MWFFPASTRPGVALGADPDARGLPGPGGRQRLHRRLRARGRRARRPRRPGAARGFGAACHAGLLAAGTEVVCVMDADASLDPAELPRLTAALGVLESGGGSGLVLGRRRPSGRGAWPPHARLGNAVLARSLNRRAGTRLHDLGPMRAARRADLLALGLEDRRFGYPWRWSCAPPAPDGGSGRSTSPTCPAPAHRR